MLTRLAPEIESVLHKQYVPDYYRQATITVLVPTQRSYYVQGYVHGPGRFRENHYRAAECSQQIQVRLNGLDFLRYGTFQQVAAVPAGHQAQAMAVQDGAEYGRVARKLVAQLEACVTGLGTLGETGLQRRPGAQFGHVVVGPGQWVDSDSNCHGLTRIFL